MTENFNPPRLCSPDPWSVVGEMRQQRGPIVAAWLVAAIALACSLQFWTRTPGAAQALPRPETP